ncbi:histone deacetylase family protein [Syntrophotalea carbinolica DSM 2380]|uniref:Histone deacetylase family protein n=1 Tax=Syntrophotalea carbinolica (strain DSM 2380 / NBRC 103641 / GraBd1) TaxID=338963 RepID=Q3A2V1_SYNC1|nr:histone deacetylase [Syntrophotalea carbinolica]ABA89306.1 histone deacetylase family protein [Syntrophotalea carbinolica DSM 2380]
MKIYYFDQHTFFLPEKHRFPASKYSMLRQRVLTANVVPPENMRTPEPVSDADLHRAHTGDYLHRFEHGLLTKAEIRLIGLPWSPELVQRVKYTAGATVAVCRHALDDGVGLSLGGGTHHACSDHGQGYCLYNDVVVAARALQAEGSVRRVLVIDCDVHQGNGTAETTTGDSSIFTFSIHGEKNFPYCKIPGDLDVGLPDGTGDEAYLRALDEALDIALSRSRPDLAIYLAGVDVHENDRLGRLALTRSGIGRRDESVLSKCRESTIPVGVVMAGGYSRDLSKMVEIQLQTVQIAASFSL